MAPCGSVVLGGVSSWWGKIVVAPAAELGPGGNSGSAGGGAAAVFDGASPTAGRVAGLGVREAIVATMDILWSVGRVFQL